MQRFDILLILFNLLNINLLRIKSFNINKFLKEKTTLNIAK